MLCCSVFAQDVKVLAKTDSSNYYVGDYINYYLEISRPQNVKVIMPSIEDSIKVLEFIEKSKPVYEPVDGKIIETHTYTFSFYDSTEALIPSMQIYYTTEGDSVKKSAFSNELFVFVNKLTVQTDGDIKDIKEPVLIPFDYLFWGLITLGVLILLGIITAVILYFRKKKLNAADSKPEIIVPPYEEAYTSLRILESKELWQQGNVKEYHSEITFIIRKYFERSFNFLALEMSSSEVIENMRNIKECEKIFDRARSFFNNADMVKFAKFVPMNSVNEEMLKQAFEMIDITKPKPVAEEQKEEVQNV